MTKLFREKNEEEDAPEADTMVDDKSIDLESLMDKMLRGEETEFTEQLAEEKPIYTEWAMQLIDCQVLLKSSSRELGEGRFYNLKRIISIQIYTNFIQI